MRKVLNRVKMYFKVTWIAIAAVAHTIVSMKMLIVPALHHKVVLILLIIKILILSIVRTMIWSYQLST